MAARSRSEKRLEAAYNESQGRSLVQRKHTILRLGRYMIQYKWLLLLAAIMTVGSNLLALVGPMLSGYAIDAIEPGMGKVEFSRVFHYAGWMAAFYVISSVLSYALSVLMITISRKVVYRMRKDVFDKMLALPAGYYDLHQTGDIISRISYDIDTVNESLSSDLIQILTTVITVGGALYMMVVISPRLVLVFAFTVPLSACITKFITGKTRPLFRARSASLGNLNGFVEEMVTGQKTLKAYCQEENVIRKFAERNKEAVETYYRAEYYGSVVGPMVNFINNLSLSLISVFGALLYLVGYMTVGQISSFVLYSRKFSGPINEAANIMSDLQSALAAAERVFVLMDEIPETADAPGAAELGREGEEVRGEVELSHVNFGYEKDRIILHDLSLKADPGRLIAVVGPTGAGKTTLINLLMRFYDPNSGEIRVDGHEIREVTRKSLRKSYAMVLQDTWLFHGSIYENLAYGKEGATMEEVVAAAKAARIHSFIKRLPEGYDTILTDDGTNISKGQKQLLTIARAMLLEARMLILDEATSNVDTRTEIQIQEAMRKLMEGKTCFVIAHRLSTIRNADLILVIKQGEVVEKGTHEELMRAEGEYFQMYTAQGE
ncbi:ABC transporter ATP-binding protein [Hungatella effluvii]|uniref:ABC transporter ATP-binding protein n=1 Tax=Hungatella effluvii TaxID=1096246 RepID=UPI002A7EFF8C|nr:ABC transporter ATP-binding protein [Hungatella effluvii]